MHATDWKLCDKMSKLIFVLNSNPFQICVVIWMYVLFVVAGWKTRCRNISFHWQTKPLSMSNSCCSHFNVTLLSNDLLHGNQRWYFVLQLYIFVASVILNRNIQSIHVSIHTLNKPVCLDILKDLSCFFPIIYNNFSDKHKHFILVIEQIFVENINSLKVKILVKSFVAHESILTMIPSTISVEHVKFLKDSHKIKSLRFCDLLKQIVITHINSMYYCFKKM